MNACNRIGYARVLFAGAGALLLAVACGSSNTSSSGASGSETHCDPFTTKDSTIDPSVCAPQLKSRSSCGASAACSWVVEVPCTVASVPDAGGADAGADGGADGGADASTERPCVALCNAARPPGSAPGGVCTSLPPDGSGAIRVQCGACGI